MIFLPTLPPDLCETDPPLAAQYEMIRALLEVDDTEPGADAGGLAEPASGDSTGGSSWPPRPRGASRVDRGLFPDVPSRLFWCSMDMME